MSEQDRILWDERWREGSHGAPDVSPFLRSLDAHLPRRGRALDVAGGRGLNALWLARRGLDVTLVDISPVGLSLAREAAKAEGFPLATVERDLEAEGLPAGPWALVTCFYYLQRSLFLEFDHVLAPGGMLVVGLPTRKNLERHARPSGRVLLEDGELPGLVRGLETVSYLEGWLDEGRHEARLVAKKNERKNVSDEKLNSPRGPPREPRGAAPRPGGGGPRGGGGPSPTS